MLHNKSITILYRILHRMFGDISIPLRLYLAWLTKMSDICCEERANKAIFRESQSFGIYRNGRGFRQVAFAFPQLSTSSIVTYQMENPVAVYLDVFSSAPESFQLSLLHTR